MGPVLFNIVISDIDSRIKCTISKLAKVTKMSGVFNTPEGWDVTQRDLDKSENCAHVNLMRFNKAKSKILHLGQGNSQYQHRLGNKFIESNLASHCGSYPQQECVVLLPWRLGCRKHSAFQAFTPRHQCIH